MNKHALLMTLAVTVLCPAAHAAITTAGWSSYNGALVCSATPWDSGDATLAMTGVQNWGPGWMDGTVSTDTLQDPILSLDSDVNNDTTFSWIGYRVNVFMANPFTLQSVNVSVPGDW